MIKTALQKVFEDEKKAFYDIGKDYSPIPFWFWNCDMDEKSVIDYIDTLQSKGVDAFCIHPRLGLPEDIGFHSPKFFRLCKLALKEAKQRGMKVVLYDEGMFPSGSAAGKVVEENPQYALKGLAKFELPVDQAEASEISVFELLGSLDMLQHFVAAAVVKKIDDESFDPATLARIDEKMPVSALKERYAGYTLLSFGWIFSGTPIKGLHYSMKPPLLADILDHDAVKCFIKHAYEPFHQHCGTYFGNTAMGIFTDEPRFAPRGAKFDCRPWTVTLAEFAPENGFALENLAYLWLKGGKKTQFYVKKFKKITEALMSKNYYKQIDDWCSKHGICLTGHPHQPGDLGYMKYFGMPGQDMVWRWVDKWSMNSKIGRESVSAQCVSSTARQLSSIRGDMRQTIMEIYGAYGWNLSFSELKWLADWMLVRGVNTVMPHAFYHSLEGQRCLESPPDMGPGNQWWEYYDIYVAYVKRMSRFVTDVKSAAQTAVLCPGHEVPSHIGMGLNENQIDFNYLDEEVLLDYGKVSSGKVSVGDYDYNVVIYDDTALFEEETLRRIEELRASGVKLVVTHMVDNSYDPAFINEVKPFIDRDFDFEGFMPDVMVSRLHKFGLDYAMVVNEGKEPVSLRFTAVGDDLEAWDPWNASAEKVKKSGEKYIYTLDAGESRVFINDPFGTNEKEPDDYELIGTIPVDPMQLIIDGKTLPFTELKSWTEIEGYEHYVGEAVYRMRFDTDKIYDKMVLSLGPVMQMAEVLVDGRGCFKKFWAPYDVSIEKVTKLGENIVTVKVHNSPANRYGGSGKTPIVTNEVEYMMPGAREKYDSTLPAGIFGPVEVKLYRKKQ